MIGAFAEAQVLSVELDASGGGSRVVVESRLQSAAAAAARKLCQMGIMLGAVNWERAGSREEARQAAWRRSSYLVGVTDGHDFLGRALKVCRGFCDSSLVTTSDAWISQRSFSVMSVRTEAWSSGFSRGAWSRRVWIGVILGERLR